MAFPAAPTESGGSKIHFGTTDGNAAAGWLAVISGATGTGANTVGVLATGTHAHGNTFVNPGGTVMANGPLTVIGGTSSFGAGTVRAIVVDGSGFPTVNINGTVTVGTHAVTQSGTWNIGTVTTVTAVTAISNALPAGTALLGGILDDGWDNAAKAVQRGLSQNTSNTTENTLLAADASNLYNITDLWWSIFTGSTAPAAATTIKFRLGAAGTTFHTVYIPATSQQVYSGAIQFKEPVRSTTNQAVTVQQAAAGGTSYEYSVGVLAYKSAS